MAILKIDIMRFWHDLWFGSVLLKDRWPTLYRLERNKSCSIASRVKRGEDGFLFVGNWSRHPASVEELSEKQDLDRMLLDFCFSDREDSWEWVDSVDGRFSVAMYKKLLRLNRDQGRNQNMQWESWVPNKVNLLVWRAEFARIPTRDALVQRRIPIPTMSCPLCEVDDENLKHLFIGCGFAYGVRSFICKWCKVDPFCAFDFKDLLLLCDNIGGNKWRKKIMRGIVMVTIWVLWKTRNAKVFQQKTSRVGEVVAEVKSFSFLWIKNRSKFKNVVWKDWSDFPLYICI